MIQSRAMQHARTIVGALGLIALMACHKPSEAPALLRPRVEQFVRLFDAGLIPVPEVAEEPPS